MAKNGHFLLYVLASEGIQRYDEMERRAAWIYRKWEVS